MHLINFQVTFAPFSPIQCYIWLPNSLPQTGLNFPRILYLGGGGGGMKHPWASIFNWGDKK